MTSIASGGGPIQVTPSPPMRAGEVGVLGEESVPGWTASAPLCSRISRMRAVLR